MIQATSNSSYVALPKVGGGPGIIVLHAWWGLTPFFKSLCDRLAKVGFVALAPDLNAGKIASTVDEAKEIMKTRDSSVAGESLSEGFQALRNHPAVEKKDVGVLGFSMGAVWASSLTVYEPSIKAVTLFYGSQTDLDFDKSAACFLGHFAEDDSWEPDEKVRKLESNLKAAGREAEIYCYPNTKHWFFEEDRPEYNAEAAHLAWKRTIAFYKKHLVTI